MKLIKKLYLLAKSPDKVGIADKTNAGIVVYVFEHSLRAVCLIIDTCRFNKGASATNAIKPIIKLVNQSVLTRLGPNKVDWFQRDSDGNLDRVIVDQISNTVSEVSWKPVGDRKLPDLIKWADSQGLYVDGKDIYKLHTLMIKLNGAAHG